MTQKIIFLGGTILPTNEAKGYSLSVFAEFITGAMLGPVTLECNWMIITLDTHIFKIRPDLSQLLKKYCQILKDIRLQKVLKE